MDFASRRITGKPNANAVARRSGDKDVRNADGLTRTKAFVVRKPGAVVEAEQLKAFVKDRLAPYKYPRQIEFLDELPKTATGKIQRFRLRECEAAR